MAKKPEFRHGDPKVVDYTPLRNRTDDRHLDDEELEHNRLLIENGVRYGTMGPGFIGMSDAAFAAAEPAAVANTVIRTMYIPAKEFVEAARAKAAQPLVGEQPQGTIPEGKRSEPMNAQQVAEAHGRGDHTNPSEWIKSSGLAFEWSGKRRYIVDTSLFTTRSRPG